MDGHMDMAAKRHNNIITLARAESKQYTRYCSYSKERSMMFPQNYKRSCRSDHQTPDPIEVRAT